MTDSLIVYREIGAVGVIELARPEKLNALTPSMLTDLETIAARIFKFGLLSCLVILLV